jgi:hypothetical protein
MWSQQGLWQGTVTKSASKTRKKLTRQEQIKAEIRRQTAELRIQYKNPDPSICPRQGTATHIKQKAQNIVQLDRVIK